MSIRTQWTDVSKETRKYIKKRDNDRCIICGKKGAVTMAHIFVSRGQGGKGSKENIVSLCTNCHYYILDNPVGKKNNNLSNEYMYKCKCYLIEKEHIMVTKNFLDTLKFNKKSYLEEVEPQITKMQIKKYDRCKDCTMLIKKSSYNNSIPTYYCRYRKINLNKTTKACDKFKKRLGNT